jgi:lysophospholipase L1-like esterase
MTKRIIASMIMAISSLFIVGGLGVFAYLYNHGLSGLYNNTQPTDKQIKVACVGDSITYGHSVENWKDNNYPKVLQKLLGEEYHVANFGVSGACVNSKGNRPYIKRTIYEESIKYDADILIFMLGSNDSKPKNWVDTEYFIKEYQELLDTYLQKESKPKVIIGICAESYYLSDSQSDLAKYSIRPEIVDEIAEAIRTKYNNEEVVLVDIHELTSAHSEWFEKDGIHPNKDGAKCIANKFADAIKEKN